MPGLALALDLVLEMRRRTLKLAEAPLRYPVFGGVPDVRCADAEGIPQQPITHATLFEMAAAYLLVGPAP